METEIGIIDTNETRSIQEGSAVAKYEDDTCIVFIRTAVELVRGKFHLIGVIQILSKSGNIKESSFFSDIASLPLEAQGMIKKVLTDVVPAKYVRYAAADEYYLYDTSGPINMIPMEMFAVVDAKKED